MDKPKHITEEAAAPAFICRAAAAFRLQNFVGQSFRQLRRAVVASAIDHDDFRVRRARAQMLEKRLG